MCYKWFLYILNINQMSVLQIVSLNLCIVIFSMMLFEGQNFFILMSSLVFYFMVCSFCNLYKKILDNLRSPRMLSFIHLETLYFTLIFWSISHFSLIFVYDMSHGWRILFLYIQLFQKHLWKEYIYLIEFFCTFSENQFVLYVSVNFSSILFHWSILYLYINTIMSWLP